VTTTAPETGPALEITPGPTTPWWLVNVPPEVATLTPVCPPALVGLSAKDEAIVGTPDAEYTRISWAEAGRLVAEYRLDEFTRVPSALRAYREYMYGLGRTYRGGVLEFILRERLRWDTTDAHDQGLFADGRDWKILRNDWPYGWAEEIAHLVVWTRFPFPTDPHTGDLTLEAKQAVESFVVEHFVGAVHGGREDVLWFKNWAALKSVPELEHFHVLLRRPKEGFMEQFT
jgi:hypothetical protein